MKIYSLSVFNMDVGTAAELIAATDLSSFSLYQRGTVAEFLRFFSKTIVERLGPGKRQSVEENAYTFHLFNREGSLGEGLRLTAVLVTDSEYPTRAAFSVLTRTLEAFVTEVPLSSFSSPPVHFPKINEYLKAYQDPRDADQIMRVRGELEETKDVLHKTIESVLARGEQLDDLVAQSQSLSDSSKLFFRTTKKQSSCCVIM